MSFQGRLYREDGQYQKALDCFADAVSIYEKQDRGHRNVARAHFNAGFVYRLLARDLGKQMTSDKRPHFKVKYAELRANAFDELKQAREIYEFDESRHARGLGKVHNVLALLFLDSSEFDRAEIEVATAFTYGSRKSDLVVMADAKIIESTLVLSGSRGFVDGPLALELAETAIGYAKGTGHRRLLARATIRKGLALLEPPNINLVVAQQCLDEAQVRLVREDRDYLRNSLVNLEQKIRAKRNSSAPIFYLTPVSIRGRSLEEITGEAEEKVIRCVYEACCGKVSKTAETLKIHPRRVRAAVSTFKITEVVLTNLSREDCAGELLEKLATLRNREVQGRATFVELLKQTFGANYSDQLKATVLRYVHPRRWRESFWPG